MILEGSVWLRVSSLVGGAFAFHYSTDGVFWRFVRQFRLDTSARPQVGFMSQAPMGPAATSRFSQISLVREQLADVRDGR
ncbi:DUF1349 domain-containing protein [Microbacterium sp. SORGH_AS_0862]|uniref:DUF1349 domain-containing protein n=1 Tax=Microbacterium sp. SORGH_AS_0862 TaxID=3041789 RepID=UPI00278DCC5E|nr:DUF1349 domain-containing protein [Microbacterium sp. SORGH_AS_0862]MDQ1205592.1 regulation of enolase protein 1 (concanavalin A-like superfamily) [Microbacterium sp. SORGH_AS_0862]